MYAETEISVVSTEILVKPTRKELSTFATSDKDSVIIK